MNFANVNSLVIPEGEVYSIACGSEILWQKSRLPLEFQEVEYIESTGEQYIDSEVIASTTIITEVKCQSFESNKCIVGVGTTASVRYQVYAGSSGYYYARLDGTESDLGNVPFTELATIKLDPVAKKATINGTEYDIPYTGTVQERSLWLFGRNQTTTPSNYLSTTKMWYCKMWDGGNLVRDFVPCYRKSDKKTGMYDLVSETFFTDANSGDFVLP